VSGSRYDARLTRSGRSVAHWHAVA